MTRVDGTLKDRGHYARKAVFWAYALSTCPFYFAFYTAGKFAEHMVGVSMRLRAWSKPCVYRRVDN